jgi:GNAT superfamily N-acetyltransferase
MADATFAALTPADFATVAALGDRIWRQHYVSIVSIAQIEYMLAGRYTDAKLAAYVDAADRWLLIVRDTDRGEPIGYFSYARSSADEVKLEQLYLLAEARGRRLGARMMTHVEDHARALGCGAVMLTVNKRNTDAIAVYTHRGYGVREEAVFDIGNGYVMDDYVMARAL